VSVAHRSDSVVEVRFEVRDTGIGISPDRIGRMFEPFSQAEAGTTRNFGGTGLGLPISRELTQLMGGSIGAKSELGKGSTFWFSVPFTPASATPKTPVSTDRLRGVRVLVVEDNVTNQQIFEAYLTSWGMRPAVADDVSSALAELQRARHQGQPFELALVDYHLPDETGLQLAARVAQSTELRGTGLILLTSSGQMLDGDASENIGYQLAKPVRQSRLLDAVCSVMASQGPQSSPSEPDRPELAIDGSRVLVAEDQQTNWMLIERLLTRRGCSVVNAADGQDALEKLEAGDYDLVLMDCQMPRLDGYDATREIRRRETGERRRHVPIVAMTASAMAGDRELCLAAGMDDYIAKPIDAAELDRVLARWLSPAATSGAASDSQAGSTA
jgi:CheY-like chemotaxis protein